MVSKWMKNGIKKNRNIAFILLSIIFIMWYIFSKVDYTSYKKGIINNYKITTGNIVGYTISGDFNNRILTYSYRVSGMEIKRKITPSNYNYDNCDNDMTLCNSKSFHVIYSVRDPGNSLIDISHEIEVIDSVYVKKYINRFE